MCAQRSFENIIFGGRTSQNAVSSPNPRKPTLVRRILFLLHAFCSLPCLRDVFIVNSIFNSIYIFFFQMKNVSKGHGAHCFCFASQHLVLKHTVRPCVAAQGLTGWSQLTPQCVGETARLFSYTEAPLWKAKKPCSHKPQGFLNKTSQSLLCNLFFFCGD